MVTIGHPNDGAKRDWCHFRRNRESLYDEVDYTNELNARISRNNLKARLD